jgi:hypothetical protein
MHNFTLSFKKGIPYRFLQFLKLPGVEKRFFLEATVWMGFFRLVILTVPFRKIASYLGEHMQETPVIENTPEESLLISQISRAISRAGRFSPWESKCLVQALTGKMMIRHRSLESTLYLGLIKKPDLEHMEAHAWLRCGSKIVCGGKELDQFTVVAAFGKTLDRKE